MSVKVLKKDKTVYFHTCRRCKDVISYQKEDFRHITSTIGEVSVGISCPTCKAIYSVGKLENRVTAEEYGLIKKIKLWFIK